MFAFHSDKTYAQQADAADVLASFKKEFHFPQKNNRDVIYFCGNSLGLQPRNAASAIETELQTWREIAVGGYFNGPNPWLLYHQHCTPALARIVGCLESEVTVMNALTVNLHLLMLSFYHPTATQYKIIMEAGAFPSDQYAVETLVKHFGFHPDDAIIEIAPRTGEKLIRQEDILDAITTHAGSLAMVLLGGINYYTGQLFDLDAITKATHAVNAIAGFDLAHVAGNVPLQLHDWNVDFAVWCSYKYLNAGPGAVGGAFVHEKHAGNAGTPRLAGWWGNDEKTRFKMEKGFIPKTDATGWNISTSQVFNTVCLKASLELFEKAGIETLRKKSIHLTAYLEFLLKQLTHIDFEIITPVDPEQRGAQLCLYFKERGKEIHDKMINSGIIVDYREPGVIRVAPAPMYCSFQDVYHFYETLKNNF